MKVELVVTRTCHHIPILERELNRIGVPYTIRYAEDNPDIVEKHNIRGSPNVLVDNELVFQGMPSISDLEAYFKKKA